MKEIAIVLSAGTGKRFGSVKPKQFIMLKSRPILYYSLKTFQEFSNVSAIVLVVHKSFYNKSKLISSAFNKVVAVIEGGERRQDSVQNALYWIENNVTEGCNRVYIHDAARPIFRSDLLDRLYAASRTFPAVIPIIPVEDTIKRVSQSIVNATVNRSEIFRVQTPQVFDFSMLCKAYKTFPASKQATDDASVMEHYGQQIYTVDGERENIKITYPVDIRIAESLIEAER
jgi:2-C-methyl-D-erythritol 4-phosphate cytidylyltransferase